MGVTVVGSTAAYNSDTSALVLSPHASTALGDYIVAYFASEHGMGVTPTGYSLLGVVNEEGMGFTVGVYGRYVSSTAAASATTFNTSIANNLTGVTASVRRILVADPTGAIGLWQATGSTQTALAPSVTASFGASLLLAATVALCTDKTWATTPTAMTTLADVPYSSLETGDQVLQVGVFYQAIAAGATGTRTAILDGATTGGKYPVAISLVINGIRSLGTPLFGINT